MTNSPKSGGAREFWIDPCPRGDQVEDEYGGVCINTELKYATKNQMHVIEYSAYDQALKRIEKLRAALELTLKHYEHPIHDHNWAFFLKEAHAAALAEDQGDDT